MAVPLAGVCVRNATLILYLISHMLLLRLLIIMTCKRWVCIGRGNQALWALTLSHPLCLVVPCQWRVLCICVLLVCISLGGISRPVPFCRNRGQPMSGAGMHFLRLPWRLSMLFLILTWRTTFSMPLLRFLLTWR